jgi:hypothetical protein
MTQNSALLITSGTLFFYALLDFKKHSNSTAAWSRSTSDFFMEEADAWRDEAWEIMKQRPDAYE